VLENVAAVLDGSVVFHNDGAALRDELRIEE